MKCFHKCLAYFFVFLFKSNLIDTHLYYPLSSKSLPFNRHVRPNNCNSIVDQKVQWLLSVNYPSSYDENLNCLYTVQKYSVDVCKVELTFPDFNVEYSLNCLNDYFLLNNGIRLCGVLAPDTKYVLEFPPGQDQLELSFVSSSNINKSGFVAIFNQLNNSCYLSTGQFQPNSFSTGYASEPNYNRLQPQDCNQRLYSFEGSLKSPNFPAFYPTNALCRYLFKRPNDSVCKIKFRLKTFDINNYPAKHDKINCDNGDYLEIMSSQNRLCGYKIQEEFVIDYKEKSSYMPLYFYSDDIGVSTGFEIEYYQLPNSCVGKDPLITTKCDQKFKEENRLTSPNYPNNYEPNSLCTYEIEPLNSTYCGFTLLFRHLNLELGVDQLGRCNKDYLELPNNERVCGTTKPLEKLFNFNTDQKQYLIFASDNQNEESGFDIQIKQVPCQELINSKAVNNNRAIGPSIYSKYPRTYDGYPPRELPAHCDQLITGKQYQIIISPGYPNYSPNCNCQYSIYKYSDNVCQIRLQFLDFDLEASNQCQNDYFVIMNTGERFCGKELYSSAKIIDFHNAEAIRLRFISDSNQYTGAGFKIAIQQLENSCRNPRTFSYFNTNINTNTNYNAPANRPPVGYLKVCGIFNQEQFNIESSNYPLTYPPNVNCLYRICKANQHVNALDIFFNDFSVGTLENNFCSNDYLEIDGERYCGHLKNQHLHVNFPPHLNIMNIRFRTNERDHHLGFKLIVKQISTTNQTLIGSRKNFDILGLNKSSENYPKYTDGSIGSISPVSPNTYKHLTNTPNQNDLYYYNQNLITQLSSANDINCLPKFFNQKHFYLKSPNYGNGNYPCSMQCNYWIKKASSNICAIQLVFDEFKIGSSAQCTKENLQVKNLKLCGTIPNQTKKTLEFSENQIIITFKSGYNSQCSKDNGFLITIQQIEC